MPKRKYTPGMEASEKKWDEERKQARQKHEDRRQSVLKGFSRVTRSIDDARRAVLNTISDVGNVRLGSGKVKEILPALGHGFMNTATGGLHYKKQNQKLSDKVDDALGRPVRPARAKRAGLTPKGTVAQKGSKKKGT